MRLAIFQLCRKTASSFAYSKTRALFPERAEIFPVMLPLPRWALTPPFHPYLTTKIVKIKVTNNKKYYQLKIIL